MRLFELAKIDLRLITKGLKKFRARTRDQQFINYKKLQIIREHHPKLIVENQFAPTCLFKTHNQNNKNCSGCGNYLHSDNPLYPGYIPYTELDSISSERHILDKESINMAPATQICNRCLQITYDINESIKVDGSKTHFDDVISYIKKFENELILLVLDLTNLPHAFPHEFLKELVGLNVYLVGNKYDLLAKDGGNSFLWVTKYITDYFQNNFPGSKLEGARVVSAVTGFQLEPLITELLSKRFQNRSIFLVGAQNSGKSRLFNRFLLSDLVKVGAREAIHRSAVCNFPGTTSGILRFPINRPRAVQQSFRSSAIKNMNDKNKQIDQKRSFGFRSSKSSISECNSNALEVINAFEVKDSKIEFVGSDFANFDEFESMESEIYEPLFSDEAPRKLLPTVYKLRTQNQSASLYDLPGYSSQDHIFHDLSPSIYQKLFRKRYDRESKEQPEPFDFILPRTFIVQPSFSLLIGSVARLDLISTQTSGNLYFVVHTTFPIHIVETAKVDEYTHRFINYLVPCASSEISSLFISRLKHKDLRQISIPSSEEQSAFDVVLSEAGWISIAFIGSNTESSTIDLRAWTPEARGIFLRTPPLIPGAFARRGLRQKSSCEFINRV